MEKIIKLYKNFAFFSYLFFLTSFKSQLAFSSPSPSNISKTEVRGQETQSFSQTITETLPQTNRLEENSPISSSPESNLPTSRANLPSGSVEESLPITANPEVGLPIRPLGDSNFLDRVLGVLRDFLERTTQENIEWIFFHLINSPKIMGFLLFFLTYIIFRAFSSKTGITRISVFQWLQNNRDLLLEIIGEFLTLSARERIIRVVLLPFRVGGRVLNTFYESRALILGSIGTFLIFSGSSIYFIREYIINQLLELMKHRYCYDLTIDFRSGLQNIPRPATDPFELIERVIFILNNSTYDNLILFSSTFINPGLVLFMASIGIWRLYNRNALNHVRTILYPNLIAWFNRPFLVILNNLVDNVLLIPYYVYRRRYVIIGSVLLNTILVGSTLYYFNTDILNLIDMYEVLRSKMADCLFLREQASSDHAKRVVDIYREIEPGLDETRKGHIRIGFRNRMTRGVFAILKAWFK